jgi:hypothetical protein
MPPLPVFFKLYSQRRLCTLPALSPTFFVSSCIPAAIMADEKTYIMIKVWLEFRMQNGDLAMLDVPDSGG